jgi:hypothetical protein
LVEEHRRQRTGQRGAAEVRCLDVKVTGNSAAADGDGLRNGFTATLRASDINARSGTVPIGPNDFPLLLRWRHRPIAGP